MEGMDGMEGLCKVCKVQIGGRRGQLDRKSTR